MISQSPKLPQLPQLYCSARDRYLIEKLGFSPANVRELVKLEQHDEYKSRIRELNQIEEAKQRELMGMPAERRISEHDLLAFISAKDEESAEASKPGNGSSNGNLNGSDLRNLKMPHEILK